MSTYEASRDLIRAQNLPWYQDYLHPSLEEYFKPSLERHGTFWFGWTATQEARWKKNYESGWTRCASSAAKGGIVTTGDDAGYLYSLYGFGHSRAGAARGSRLPAARSDRARDVERREAARHGGPDRPGSRGFIADLLVVNGNPLENLKLLNPYGADSCYERPARRQLLGADQARRPTSGRVHGGGIEWTIKDGIPYHVPTLMREVKDMVGKARAERDRSVTRPASR